jgi:hypothetical protein
MIGMKESVRFLIALISGLGVTATVFSPPAFQRPAGSDLSRMRGDVERVGATMRTVIQREHARRSARS